MRLVSRTSNRDISLLVTNLKNEKMYVCSLVTTYADVTLTLEIANNYMYSFTVRA
jgi:hypothetical protein